MLTVHHKPVHVKVSAPSGQNRPIYNHSGHFKKRPFDFCRNRTKIPRSKHGLKQDFTYVPGFFTWTQQEPDGAHRHGTSQKRTKSCASPSVHPCMHPRAAYQPILPRPDARRGEAGTNGRSGPSPHCMQMRRTTTRSARGTRHEHWRKPQSPWSQRIQGRGSLTGCTAELNAPRVFRFLTTTRRP